MIIVLEGGIGTGKTTLGKALSKDINRPLYRSFRRDGDDHTPGSILPVSIHSVFPVNTWVEDMFQMDVFRALRPDVICDRGMPSALAYNAMDLDHVFTCLPEGQGGEVAAVWGRMLRDAHGVVLELVCDLNKRMERTGDRIFPARILGRAEEMGLSLKGWMSREAELISKCCEAVSWVEGLEVYRLDTTGLDRSATLQRAKELLAVG